MEGVVVVYFRESPNGGSGFLFILGNHPMEGVVIVYFRESPNGGRGCCLF